MATFDEALAEVGKGEDMAVDIARQGLGSAQGQRDGWMDLPEKEVGEMSGVTHRAETELGMDLEGKMEMWSERKERR